MHIIRPEIFYICSVVNNISYISSVCLIASVFATGVIALFYFGAKINDEDDTAFLKRLLGKMLIPLIISAAAATFVPDKKVMYQMIAADIATYENIDLVADTIENKFDHIIDRMHEMQESE